MFSPEAKHDTKAANFSRQLSTTSKPTTIKHFNFPNSDYKTATSKSTTRAFRSFPTEFSNKPKIDIPFNANYHKPPMETCHKNKRTTSSHESKVSNSLSFISYLLVWRNCGVPGPYQAAKQAHWILEFPSLHNIDTSHKDWKLIKAMCAGACKLTGTSVDS